MKNTLTSFLFCFTVLSASAQSVGGQGRYCYTDEMWAQMVQRDSSLLENRRQMDLLISHESNQKVVRHGGIKYGSADATGATTVIPTVIYVVYDTSAVNISMTQIQSQMDQLNQNMAPYGFSFCYAHRNVLDSSYFVPQAGDSAGVFRVRSTLSNVIDPSTDAQLKALSPLPWQNYLRIFIVHTITPNGVLGYTVMPGSNSPQDGIVMRYDVFGSNNYCPACQLYPSYNLGAALTHEIGHFLDLYHTFQGGCDTGSGTGACQIYGDQVCDTPPTDGSFGCPSPAPLSCNGVDTELIQNYMDYTDDPCKNSFTVGQESRMNFAVQAYRSLLVSTANLISTGVTCTALGNQYADFYCTNYNGCTSRPMTFASLGSAGFTYSWNFGDGSTATGDTVSHTYTAAGQYLVTLNAVSSSANVNVTTSTPVFVTACYPTTCSMNKWNFEFGFMDFSTGTPIAVNHKLPNAAPSFADFYSLFYRGDNAGNPLFSIGARSNDDPFPETTLLDTAFNMVDSFAIGANGSQVLVQVPGRSKTFCYVMAEYRDSAANVNNLDTLAYSIITAQNGTASIVPGKKLIHFPFPSPTTITGQVGTVAIPNCSGDIMWIVTNIAENFMVFRLDSTETITYHSTFSIPDTMSFYYLAASPNGRMIAMNGVDEYGTYYGVSYLTFDNSTGTITGYNKLYGAIPAYYPDWSLPYPCFSPNSRYLYYTDVCCNTELGNNANICQSDMFSANPYATRKIIFQYPVNNIAYAPFHRFHIGPDGKLYIGQETLPGNSPAAYRLGVINNPNVAENGLNSTGYNPNGPDIRPVNSPYALNISFDGFGDWQDNTDAFGCSWQPDVPNPFSYLATSCLNYSFFADQCYAASWHFGDAASGTADTSTLNSPHHVFSNPGSYTVTLVTNGYTFSDTIVIAPPSVQISGTPVSPCPTPYANYSIANVQPSVNYSWTVTNGLPATASDQSNLNINWNPADTTGEIMVIATDTVMGCTDTAYLQAHYNAGDTPIVIWNGPDTIDQHTGAIPLSGATPTGGIYSGTGVNGNTFYPDSVAAGSYTLTYTYISPNGCIRSVSNTYVVLGLNDIDLEDQIYLHPNPANDLVVAQSERFTSAAVTTMLYDMTGRMISVPVTNTAGKISFDVSSLAEGVYSIKFVIGGEEATKRFIKIE